MQLLCFRSTCSFVHGTQRHTTETDTSSMLSNRKFKLLYCLGERAGEGKMGSHAPYKKSPANSFFIFRPTRTNKRPLVGTDVVPISLRMCHYDDMGSRRMWPGSHVRCFSTHLATRHSTCVHPPSPRAYLKQPEHMLSMSSYEGLHASHLSWGLNSYCRSSFVMLFGIILWIGFISTELHWEMHFSFILVQTFISAAFH